MPSEIRAPILSYEAIRRVANDCLATHHPSRSLPVPIEEIIDLRLAIHIIPVPGIQRAIGVDAFTSSDCSEITVDEFISMKRSGRYRFGLAHELGHIMLHKAVYCLMTFRTIAEWMAFVRLCSPEQHMWLEYQAHSFAGLLLVPKDLLECETDKAVTKAIDYGINVDPRRNENAWEFIAEYLADSFGVSKDVISRRLRMDRVGTPGWLRLRKYL